MDSTLDLIGEVGTSAEPHTLVTCQLFHVTLELVAVGIAG